MNIKHFLMILLLLPVLSCERIETVPDWQPTGTSLPFSLDTKSLPEGERTYRVVMVTADGSLKGNGTYYNKEITPGEMGSWLSPCLVNEAGEPLTSTGSIANSFEEADHSSIHGLRYSVTYRSTLYLSAVSPAIEAKSDKEMSDDGKTYFPWDAEKTLYLSDSKPVFWQGSWIGGNYIYDPRTEEELKLIDRRARFFVHIECGELDEADIQAVRLTYVNTARWYVLGGFSAAEGHYTTTMSYLYDHTVDGGIKHLEKSSGDVWDSDGSYILPLAYKSENQYQTMQPQLEVLLGTDTEPGRTTINLSEDIEPMKDYLLTLRVSKQYIWCRLTALDWYDVNPVSTSDEEWAKIAINNGVNPWDTPAPIGTDDWNPTL